MNDFLERMASSSRDRASFLRRDLSDDELDQPVAPLSLSNFDIIAEIKHRSPSAGVLGDPDDDREQRALNYADAGAVAISVLTEPFRFGGEIGHLEAVVRAVGKHNVPVMRKDFLVDTAQVLEAKAAGASGVLLIAAILDDGELESMLACASEHSLFVLLEAFSEDDLERLNGLLEQSEHAQAAERRELLFGVNCRNLRTLDVDETRFERFVTRLPKGVMTVAESGLETAEDAARIAALGYNAALVGSALMRAKEPKKELVGMLTAGRSS